jgi:hypothetical protein
MKRFILLLCLIPFTTHAANMCVKNDTVFVALDPNATASSSRYDNSARTWSITFGFGTISGIAGCGENDKMGTNSFPVPNQNDVSTSATGGGVYYKCACKMLLPVESLWIATAAHSTGCNQCAQNCISNSPRQEILAAIFSNIIP